MCLQASPCAHQGTQPLPVACNSVPSAKQGSMLTCWTGERLIAVLDSSWPYMPMTGPICKSRQNNHLPDSDRLTALTEEFVLTLPQMPMTGPIYASMKQAHLPGGEWLTALVYKLFSSCPPKPMTGPSIHQCSIITCRTANGRRH